MNTNKKMERLFHLYLFYICIKTLELKVSKDYQKQKFKKQLYYSLNFSLSAFVAFTDMKILKQAQWKNLIQYFKQLQNLDPIAK